MQTYTSFKTKMVGLNLLLFFFLLLFFKCIFDNNHDLMTLTFMKTIKHIVYRNQYVEVMS